MGEAKCGLGAVVSRTGLIDFWAPGADPDDDGRNNALEAYLGSDPLQANNSPFSTYTSNNELVMRWNKKNGYRGVEASADWSSRVAPWTGAAASIINRPDLINLIGYTIQEAKVAVPAGVRQRYLQLNVTIP